MQGEFGAVEIEVPRDRNGSFEPKILPKDERRFQGFLVHIQTSAAWI